MLRKYIQKNREAINKLTLGLRMVEEKLNNTTHVLSAQINEVGPFCHIYAQIDIVIAQIRQLINNADRYLDNLRTELSFPSLGHISPDIISPRDLINLLTSLRNQIPKGFKLSLHLHENYGNFTDF